MLSNSSKLTKTFVQKNSSSLKDVPKSWEVIFGGHYYYYTLNLRMCQLQDIQYAFSWGDESDPSRIAASIADQPSRILHLDVSLNDLTSLNHQGLAPLKQLRSINASLNHIYNYTGIECVRHLCTLNLSHNKIKHIMALEHAKYLIELNLSMNEINDIEHMPPLSNLRVVHLNNNRLQNLNGIQSLPGLKELYVQRNQIETLLPLVASQKLMVLNAADNKISSLNTTLEILQGLKSLRILSLYGNPIEINNREYQEEMKSNLELTTLDNIVISGLQRAHNPNAGTLEGVKETARRAFTDHMNSVRTRTEENILFLQKRVMSLQEEHRKFEERMEIDLKYCLAYLDKLPLHEAERYNYDFLREKLSTPAPKPWRSGKEGRGAVHVYTPPTQAFSVSDEVSERLSLPPIDSPRTVTPRKPKPSKRSKPQNEIPEDDEDTRDPGVKELERWRRQRYKEWDDWDYKFSPRGRKPRSRADYSSVKNTDEVLRCAYNELCLEGPQKT